MLRIGTKAKKLFTWVSYECTICEGNLKREIVHAKLFHAAGTFQTLAFAIDGAHQFMWLVRGNGIKALLYMFLYPFMYTYYVRMWFLILFLCTACSIAELRLPCSPPLPQTTHKGRVGVVYSVLQELVRRSGLKVALSGRTEEELIPVLQFLARWVVESESVTLEWWIWEWEWNLWFGSGNGFSNCGSGVCIPYSHIAGNFVGVWFHRFDCECSYQTWKLPSS